MISQEKTLVAGEWPGGFQQGLDDAVQHRLVELRLGAVVIEHVGLRHAGALGDVAEPGGAEAAVGEDFAGGVEDQLQVALADLLHRDRYGAGFVVNIFI